MIRLLLIFLALLSATSWGQSSLPPCPEFGLKHNCFGAVTFRGGNVYAGEWRWGKLDGQGTLTFANGGKHSGEWRVGERNGLAGC